MSGVEFVRCQISRPENHVRRAAALPEPLRNEIKTKAKDGPLRGTHSPRHRLSKATTLRHRVGAVGEKALEVVMDFQQMAELRNKITPQQMRVLRYIAQGKRTKDIADELLISAKTVENHRLALARNLGLRGIADLTRLAIRVGLVEA